MKKFWDWIHDDSGGRVLRLEGPIDSESFWGDEITPQMFRDELYAEEGDITLWVNSPGGNVFAAAEIYTMIRDYPGNVTVRIASIAASAASVVAMAGNVVQISPTGLIMVHDPSTIAMGNAKDMEKAISTLNEVKESIINAYAFKTGLTRNRISKLMSDETWLNAKKAVELGFADEILFESKKDAPEEDEEPGGEDPAKEEGGDEDGEEKKKPFKLEEADAVWQFSTKVMGEAILDRLGCFKDEAPGGASGGAQAEEPTEDGVGGGGTDSDGAGSEDTANNPMETSPADTDTKPVIGMDGKTEDGAVPYEILKKKLEWLK
ncbi:MAG: Clp protease ClpP [Lachnospiraceae bacterium]|nr:Clp protease ClpP [Lachnospiraceae bacterium]